MAIEYFNAYHSYLKSIEPLNDAERGRLFTALLEYSSTGVTPDLRGNERFIFPTMKEQIDRDMQKHGIGIKHLGSSGKNHWNWKGGITPKNQVERRSIEYKEWRNSVFKRDGYVCAHCGKKGGDLAAHHIKPWAKFPDSRFDVSNGITLCKECHKKEHRVVKK